MSDILVAMIGSGGIIGAAIITGRMAFKLRDAGHRADSNDDRFWAVIDDLRSDLARVTAERDNLQSVIDAQPKDGNGG